MPSKLRLRRVFRPLVVVLAKGLNKMGLSPNIATLFVLLLAFVSFVSITLFHNLLIFAIFVFLTGLFDGIDGQIARLNNQSSNFGGFLDSVTDRISEFIIYLGFVFYLENDILWGIINMEIVVIVILVGSLMISYLRAKAEVLFKGDFDYGLMARSERLFYIFITMLISNYIGFVNEFLFIFMFLILGTGIFRFYKIKKMIQDFEEST